jgi:hypothetical protein
MQATPFRLLSVLLLSVRALAAAVPPPHTCALVELVRTSLPVTEATNLVRVFQEEAERRGVGAPEPLSRRLSEERGGFWDVLFIGNAFSYTVTCSEIVELASDAWNILLCRESEDEAAERCGPSRLARYANGTLARTPAPPHASIRLERYANFMVDDAAAAHAARVPQAERLVHEALRAGTLHSPGAAEALRKSVEALWPETTWNVLVENVERAGGQYYYAEEQFNFEAIFDGMTLSVAIFDRRCETLEREARAGQAQVES